MDTFLALEGDKILEQLESGSGVIKITETRLTHDQFPRTAIKEKIAEALIRTAISEASICWERAPDRIRGTVLISRQPLDHLRAMDQLRFENTRLAEENRALRDKIERLENAVDKALDMLDR